MRKSILVAVVGMNPQVVTEILYALHKKNQHIDEIHLWTTTRGQVLIQNKLLDFQHGKYYAFCRDYNIQPVPVIIHVAKDEQNNPLDDIRTLTENEAVANRMSEFIREISANERHRLICSIAGGRKTMSVYLALALQFYGRVGDRLYHVLIQPSALEANPDFFYPPPKPKPVQLLNGETISTDEVVIDLAEMPIVWLRHYIPVDKLEKGITFTELVNKTQQSLQYSKKPPKLIIDVPHRQLYIADYSISLTPTGTALYAWLAERRMHCLGSECDRCEKCFMSMEELIQDDARVHDGLRRIIAFMEGVPVREAGPNRWIDPHPDTRKAALSETKSKVNRSIEKKAGSSHWVTPYLIETFQRPDEFSLTGIPLKPEYIELHYTERDVLQK